MMKRLVALVVLVAAAASLAAQDAKISLAWAFAKRAPNGAAVPVDFSERVGIKPGDFFKIYIQPTAGSYVYLILQDASNEVQFLFPEGFELFVKPSYAQGKYFIPEGDDWFTLDSTKGTERFYLLASSERLGSLETLLAALDRTVSSAKSTVAEKNAARQAALDEIKRLIQAHSRLAAAVEKPVSIAGGTRGINDSVAKLATRIEAQGFYSKIFRLEH